MKRRLVCVACSRGVGSGRLSLLAGDLQGRFWLLEAPEPFYLGLLMIFSRLTSAAAGSPLGKPTDDDHKQGRDGYGKAAFLATLHRIDGETGAAISSPRRYS